LGRLGRGDFVVKRMQWVLAYDVEALPVSVFATAAVAGIPIQHEPVILPPGLPPAFFFRSGEEIHGTRNLLRYLGRIANVPDFYNRDAFATTQIDEWLEYANVFSARAEFERSCTYLDNYLSLRTFLVGDSLSVADIAVWSGLAGTGRRGEGIRISNRFQNLVRWYNSILSAYPVLSQISQHPCYLI